MCFEIYNIYTLLCLFLICQNMNIFFNHTIIFIQSLVTNIMRVQAPLNISLSNLYDKTFITLRQYRARVAQYVRQLNNLTTHTSLSPIQHGFAPDFVNYKKGALDSQSQVIQFTNPMVGGSLWVLRLLPPLKLVATIQLKYC